MAGIPSNLYGTGYGAGFSASRAESTIGSPLTAPLGSGRPVNTVAGVLSGLTAIGSTLTATRGTWLSSTPATYTYQFQGDGVNIGSPQTALTYVTQVADSGKTIRYYVIATNAVGSTSGALSNGIVVLGDADVTDWVARVVSNGGTASGTVVSAAITLVTAAKANGYWSTIGRWNFFGGDQLAACMVPLKVGVGGNAVEVNTGPFVEADFDENIGLNSVGATNKFLETGFTGDEAGQSVSGGHCSIYNIDAAPQNKEAIGFVPGGGPGVYINPCYGDNKIYASLHAQSSEIGAAGSQAGNRGVLVINRESSTNLKLYKNGVQVGSSATLNVYNASSSYVFTAAFTTGRHCKCILGGYTMGAAMTAAQVASFSTDFAAFSAAMGRSA